MTSSTTDWYHWSLGRDVLRLEARVQRKDETLRRELRDEAPVHLHDVGHVAAGEARGELLGVECRRIQFDVDVAELLLCVVEAGLADVVRVLEAPCLEGSGGLGGVVDVAARTPLVIAAAAAQPASNSADAAPIATRPIMRLRISFLSVRAASPLPPVRGFRMWEPSHITVATLAGC